MRRASVLVVHNADMRLILLHGYRRIPRCDVAPAACKARRELLRIPLPDELTLTGPYRWVNACKFGTLVDRFDKPSEFSPPHLYLRAASYRVMQARHF